MNQNEKDVSKRLIRLTAKAEAPKAPHLTWGYGILFLLVIGALAGAFFLGRTVSPAHGPFPVRVQEGIAAAQNTIEERAAGIEQAAQILGIPADELTVRLQEDPDDIEDGLDALREKHVADDSHWYNPFSW